MASSKRGMRKRAKLAKAKKEIDKKTIKGMANAMRVQILTILNERMNSATGIAKELGVDFGEVSYEMAVLRDIGMIEVAREVRRRGAVEVFYRANSRALLDAYEWPSVPDVVKGSMRASLLQTLMDDAIAAVEEETYDSLDGAHMSWSPLLVDDQGWDELVEILRKALEASLEVHAASAKRLEATNAEGMSCTVSILGYGSAHDNRKIGPPIDAKDLSTSIERPAKANQASRESKRAGKGVDATAKGRRGKANSKSKRGDIAK